MPFRCVCVYMYVHEYISTYVYRNVCAYECEVSMSICVCMPVFYAKEILSLKGNWVLGHGMSMSFKWSDW